MFIFLMIYNLLTDPDRIVTRIRSIFDVTSFCPALRLDSNRSSESFNKYYTLSKLHLVLSQLSMTTLIKVS